MNIQSNIILLFLIICWQSTIAQKNNHVIITADVSGYNGKLPISKFKEWGGNDSLVPSIINTHAPSWDGMGAEYLIFSSDGTASDPKNDSAKNVNKMIWRQKAKIYNNVYRWDFETRESRMITNESLLGGSYLIFPEDSIHITFHQSSPIFSGRGAARLQIAYQIREATRRIEFPDKKQNYTFAPDIERYLIRNKYLNDQIDTGMTILNANRSAITQFDYDWLKGSLLASTENNRWLYFVFLWQAKKNNPALLYSIADVINMWDTTMYSPDAQWFRSSSIQDIPGVGNIGYAESFHLIEIRRKFNFIDHDSTTNSPSLKKQLYHLLKSNYTGLYRERILCYFLAEEIIQEMMAPYNWFAKSIMDDYYTTPGFSAYKDWMTKLEKSKEMRYKGVSSAGFVPLFNLKDQNNSNYTLQQTTGKITVANFWYTGCESCKQTAKDLKNLQEKYKRDTNVLFLNVSVDQDKQLWRKSIDQGKYVAGGTHLYTDGKGKAHGVVKDFNVTSYPTIRVYNQNGYIVFDSKEPFATTFNEKQLSAIIEGQLSKFDDGPYVFHENGKVKTYTIDKDKAIEGPLSQLRSSTDEFDRPLQLNLQKKISVPASTYPAAFRLLVLSDIEGNFTPFKKLLQANGVMDENFNWKFGKGHLVFAGDMFDRGDQVTECLWLVYSLEEKAKVAGGMVHFILGNHEIMNLQGDHRYVVDKYKKNAELMGKTLTQLYNEDSELGMWLRSKNIVEKVGDLLFMHGGVSGELNNASVTIKEINELARPHYADTTRKYSDKTLNTIMSSSVGPFWFRGYYDGLPIESMIDSTFKKFDVKHIVTGHTIIADVITSLYGGKIINTDVRHAGGKSEALLIEGNNFYRVNTEGKRVLLFTDNKRKVSGK